MKSVLLSLLFLCGLAHADTPSETAASTEAIKPIMGALAKTDIGTVVKANKHRIKDCFNAGLQLDPDLSGRVNLKFIIGKTGAVSKSEVKETTLNHAETEACMVAVAKSMQFPEPEGGGIVIVTYPFALSGD